MCRAIPRSAPRHREPAVVQLQQDVEEQGQGMGRQEVGRQEVGSVWAA